MFCCGRDPSMMNDNPKCLDKQSLSCEILIDEFNMKMWYMHIVEYYSTVKNEICQEIIGAGNNNPQGDKADPDSQVLNIFSCMYILKLYISIFHL